MKHTRISGSPEPMAARYPRLAGAGQPRLTSPVAQGHGPALTQRTAARRLLHGHANTQHKSTDGNVGSSSPAGNALPEDVVSGDRGTGTLK